MSIFNTGYALTLQGRPTIRFLQQEGQSAGSPSLNRLRRAPGEFAKGKVTALKSPVSKETVSRETAYLYMEDRVQSMGLKPEIIPCFLTTAFNMDNLHDVNRVYAEHGYTYIRTRNPNRDALAEVIAYIVINSLTKFLNGHSDAVGGSGSPDSPSA